MINILSPKDAEKFLINGEAILIDVREPDEFKNEHIAYALSLPLSGINDALDIINIPVNKKVIFQCFKGSRGEKACAIFTNNDQRKNEIYNIEGGITAWKEQGLPVIRERNTGLSIFRQIQIIVGFLIALCISIGLLGFTAAFVIAGLIATALFIAGLTGWCGLAMLLSHMPWNKKS